MVLDSASIRADMTAAQADQHERHIGAGDQQIDGIVVEAAQKTFEPAALAGIVVQREEL